METETEKTEKKAIRKSLKNGVGAFICSAKNGSHLMSFSLKPKVFKDQAKLDSVKAEYARMGWALTEVDAA